jgi:predicted lipid-binding transport protein (Tim44 family)
MEDKFVIVAEYMNSIEAELARQVLEDFKIPVIIVGQNAGDGRIGVFETVKLQVKQSDTDQARQILEEQQQSYEPGDLEEMDELDEPYEPEEQEEQ